MKTSDSSDAPQLTPFAQDPPFLIFYETYNEARYYRVRGKGFPTRDLLKATRYPLNRYQEEINSAEFEPPLPRHAALIVSIHLPAYGVPTAYAGAECILKRADIALPFFDQAARSARKLIQPLLRTGGPNGACIEVGPKGSPQAKVCHVTIELWICPEAGANIPASIEGFTRLSEHHFKGNRGAPPDGVVLERPIDKLADKQAASLKALEKPSSVHLYFHTLPQKLRAWCKESGINGWLFECYDGGGYTGYVIEVEDPSGRDRLAKEFAKQLRQHQCLLGEAVHCLGRLF